MKNKKNIDIIYGSESDIIYMEKAKEYLCKKKITFREKVISAHRTPDKLEKYIVEVNTKEDSPVLILAVAGLSAALPGILASRIDTPVIGIPVPVGDLKGLDALSAMAQVPGDVPLVTVGLHKKSPLNAVKFVSKIMKIT